MLMLVTKPNTHHRELAKEGNTHNKRLDDTRLFFFWVAYQKVPEQAARPAAVILTTYFDAIDRFRGHLNRE